MTTPTDNSAYVQKIQQESRRLSHEILRENERLRAMTATLESECHRLEEELRQRASERAALLDQLRGIEAESQRLAAEYSTVEQQNMNLANLYVASYRLHSTMDRNEVLTAIQEIIINLVGSEEIAIFELARGSDTLSLCASCGVDPALYQSVRLGQGLIGTVAARGELYVSGDRLPAVTVDTGMSLTACIPLLVGERVTGVIAVFRLLQQKNGLEALDREIFTLLATHAAMALYCTALEMRTKKEAAGAL